jgi:NAD+ kinase
MKKFLVVAEDNTTLKRRISRLLKGLDYIYVHSPREKNSAQPDDVTDIQVVSGDGGMLQAFDRHHWRNLPFCGLNIGHVGFLMNEPTPQVIHELADGKTVSVFLKSLKAKLYFDNMEPLNRFAYNEFCFERTSPQTAKIKVTVDQELRFDPLVCDGVLVSTQAGSTAYNASAGGAILPLETEAMVLTGICPAIYHRWRTSLLPNDSVVTVEPIETEKRPVRFLFDGKEIPGVIKAEIGYSDSILELKFAKSQTFREKVLNLQFARN